MRILLQGETEGWRIFGEWGTVLFLASVSMGHPQSTTLELFI